MIAAGGACRSTPKERLWQVVRVPGAQSCAVTPLDSSNPAYGEYREQIGRYRSQADAETALARFKSTPDRMTSTAATICH